MKRYVYAIPIILLIGIAFLSNPYKEATHDATTFVEPQEVDGDMADEAGSLQSDDNVPQQTGSVDATDKGGDGTSGDSDDENTQNADLDEQLSETDEDEELPSTTDVEEPQTDKDADLSEEASENEIIAGSDADKNEDEEIPQSDVENDENAQNSTENKTIDMGYNKLINHPEGFSIVVPEELVLDNTLAKYITKAANEKFSVTVSAERSPYEDVAEYLSYYQNRFYTNENFLASNNIIKHEDYSGTTADIETRIITLELPENELLPYSVYTFAYQHSGDRNFMRYMFRGDEFTESYKEEYLKVLNSYEEIAKSGVNVSTLNPSFKVPSHLDAATRELLMGMQESQDVKFGIFVESVYTKGISETIPAMEEKIGVPFDIVLMYSQIDMELDLVNMQKAIDQGKLIEFTLQISAANNMDMYGYTPMFDVANGKLDDEIRTIAQGIKSLEAPILFRLNNEANSDWTSYSGIVTMSDPEIYIEVWRRIYDIFVEEGVTNTLWIWNPNDRNYPPTDWNNFMCYYPGDEYVQMIGVTGYNTGDYYRSYIGETWRDFEHIYDEVEKAYSPFFSDFPWIITEFASSSHGGDKAQWISDMFTYLPKYENIKAAVWFSYADYDPREGKEHIPARPYWLDETPESLEAYRVGINEWKAQNTSE